MTEENNSHYESTVKQDNARSKTDSKIKFEIVSLNNYTERFASSIAETVAKPTRTIGDGPASRKSDGDFPSTHENHTLVMGGNLIK